MTPRPSRLADEKTKAETKLLELQLQEHRRQSKMEDYKSLATIITTLVAVTGLFFSIFQQHNQSVRLEKQRIDDAFNKDIQQFASSTTLSSKLVSISKLTTYFQSDYQQYHNQLINLFMTYIESDSAPSVKSLIQKSLVDNTSPQVLSLLLDQNRKLQKALSKLQLGQEKQAFLPDSAIQPAATQGMANLLWNMNTIVLSMNKIRQIKGFDFSNIVLSRNELVEIDMGSGWADTTKRSKYSPKRYTTDLLSEPLQSNLYFEDVSFRNASLSGLYFVKDTFKNVNFDRSFLIGSQFSSSLFFDSCSFHFFYPVGDFGLLAPGLVILSDNPTTWENCTMELTNFSPLPFFQGEGSAFNPRTYFKMDIPFFHHCTWHIDQIDQESKNYFPVRNTN
jgi:uncharacterized protein YjbI with pentapeptide repeats